MKRIAIAFLFVATMICSGCSANLLPVKVDSLQPLDGYKYFYMIPTGDKSGTTGVVYGTAYGTYGTTHQKSTNPADVISGFLIKRGLIRVAELPGPHPEVLLLLTLVKAEDEVWAGCAVILWRLRFSSCQLRRMMYCVPYLEKV